MGSRSHRDHGTTTGSAAGSAVASIVGAVAAIVGGLACIHFFGGVVGTISGVAVAVLLYLGIGMLLEPQAKLGGIVASDIPDGEVAAACVSQAQELCSQLQELSASVRDAQVRAEIGDLVHDIEALAGYVEKQPSAHRRLSHFLNVYGDQCVPMMRGYMSVESGSGTESFDEAHKNVVEALDVLEGAAQGELERAMTGKVTELSAGTESIRRLLEMDGYSVDARRRTEDAPDGGDASRDEALRGEGKGTQE